MIAEVNDAIEIENKPKPNINDIAITSKYTNC
jgi:hypothetical protein